MKETALNIKKQFTKIHNEYHARYLHVSVATRFMKRDIEKGILPKILMKVFDAKKKSTSTAKRARNRFNSNLKLKYMIKLRDGFKCRRCHRGYEADLIVHHIKPISKYPELVTDPDNLMTLCVQCHRIVHVPKPKRKVFHMR